YREHRPSEKLKPCCHGIFRAQRKQTCRMNQRARLLDRLQTKPVFIHHLAVTDSVDVTVLAALQSKHITQKALLGALKKDITGRLAHDLTETLRHLPNGEYIGH
ncbi:hypothetical protein, partial [Microbulbifer sp. 2205BS26-8]|uniref:hypothetical protein n=1 Tax=Microbulbifer sp. 2205BS26-8 TaxID=3064386 RepID=UPI00273E6870